MEIQRAPREWEERPNSPRHESVCTVPISKSPWNGRKWLPDLNISTDRATKRKSVIDIGINEKEVLLLYEGLVKGLRKRSKQLDSVRLRISRVEEKLRKIRDRATSHSADNTQDSLVAICRMADSALKGLR